MGRCGQHSLRQGRQGKKAGKTSLGNVTASSHHLLSASSNTCHENSHTCLPPLLALLSFPPHLHLSPLFSLITLSVSAPQLCLSNQHRYNYTDAVATVIQIITASQVHMVSFKSGVTFQTARSGSEVESTVG